MQWKTNNAPKNGGFKRNLQKYIHMFVCFGVEQMQIFSVLPQLHWTKVKTVLDVSVNIFFRVTMSKGVPTLAASK